MKSESNNHFVPLLIAFGVVAGILIGSFFTSYFSGRKLSIISSSNKVNDLFHLIEDQYVDTVSMSDLVEKSLPEILKQLDPHSTYVSAKDVEASMQDLKGSFSGIGVQFTIYNDTARVVRVIKGGPSENVGLQAGDRIIAVDGKPYVGTSVTSDETVKRLKGPMGTTVGLTVLRTGTSDPLKFSIVRGDVPVKSISAAYMVNDSIGYIRINSFGNTTYPEFLAALAKLRREGFTGLMLDLRGNLGGYMEPAVQIANEFLTKDRLIVYTEGRKSPRQEYRSDGRGTYPRLPLVVLVDETSASASEILTGAVQDNDRGTIVGRRTFGKGLVQVPIEFSDGSMLRLTKARYYTPSGRCVQKPYTPGDESDYEADLMMRAVHGEYFSADSIKTGGKQYKTTGGRIVYGGGGIIPDVFVPEDTTGITSWFKEAYVAGMLFQYAYVLTDTYRTRLNQCDGDVGKIITYLNTLGMVEKFATFAEGKGLKRRNLLIAQSSELIKRYLTANVLDDLLDTEASLTFTNASDPTFLAAADVLKMGKATPQLQKSSAGGSTASACIPSSSVFTWTAMLGAPQLETVMNEGAPCREPWFPLLTVKALAVGHSAGTETSSRRHLLAICLLKRKPYCVRG